MATFLEDIVVKKRAEVEETKTGISGSQIRNAAEQSERPRDFTKAIRGDTIRCIAEIKKASPSKGILAHSFDPSEIAKEYSAGGAHALSVLTEINYFKGYPAAIREVKKTSLVPVLRKDFVIDEYQIYESRAIGADAILLIVGILDPISIVRFLRCAHSLELACLVECHNEDEIGRALDAGAEIIGVNNRDLHTFKTTLETSFRLRGKIPAGKVCVSESGIKTRDDVTALSAAGYHAILVGEQLMTAENRTEALRTLLLG